MAVYDKLPAGFEPIETFFGENPNSWIQAGVIHHFLHFILEIFVVKV